MSDSEHSAPDHTPDEPTAPVVAAPDAQKGAPDREHAAHAASNGVPEAEASGRPLPVWAAFLEQVREERDRTAGSHAS